MHSSFFSHGLTLLSKMQEDALLQQPKLVSLISSFVLKLYPDLKYLRKSGFMMLLYVLSHWRSGPKCFITGVAWHNDSFKVICFNMIFDGSNHAFFCTHFALVKELFSIGVFVLTFLHHRLHCFFKVVQVCIIVARDCNCRTVFRFSLFAAWSLSLWRHIWNNWSHFKIDHLCWGKGLFIHFKIIDFLFLLPIKPLSWSSSANARNESRFSCKTLATPW